LSDCVSFSQDRSIANVINSIDCSISSSEILVA